MTTDAIHAALERAFVIVTIGLSLFTCLALVVRRRWPSLGVRAATSVALLVAFILSPAYVSLAAGPTVRLGWFMGIFVHPGWWMRFGPAAIATVVGVVFWVTLMGRGRSQSRVPVA